LGNDSKTDNLPSEWNTIPIKCNYCGIDNSEKLWIKNGFQYVICNKCGLIYVNPQLAQSDVEKIYSIGFDSKSSSKPPPLDFDKYDSVLKKFNKYNSTNRFLDIGCFKGFLMKAANQIGWEVYGTELSEKAAVFAREYSGGTVKVGSLLDEKYKSDYFDVASMVDVIEHFDDPGEYLEEVYRILRKGGMLYIETPNFNSIPRKLLGKNWSIIFPWHMYYFTPKTLKYVLRKAGFGNINIFTTGIGSFSKYNPLDDLESNRNIARQSRFGLRKKLRKIRLLRKLFYLVSDSADYLFYLLSKIGLNVGVKIVVTAKK